MHVIPTHAGRPSDDPIFALNLEASDRKGRGEAVVNATVGALLDDDGKLSILPTAARVVREVPAGEWAAYAPIAGSVPYLRAVQDDLFATAPELRAASIAVATPGGTGALRHAIANFLEPGQALLTTSYYWGPYHTLAEEADRKVATFRMFAPPPEGEAATNLDVEALERAVGEQLEAQGRVLLFLNDPCHNPTGYSMTAGEWAAVAGVLAKLAGRGRPITVLVDMAYAAYGDGPSGVGALAALAPLLGKVGLLFAWSASKTYTHYGLRVGALVACVADPNERAATEAAFSYSCRGTWSNCNRGGLTAITRLLTERELAGACDRERDALKATLRARVAAWNALAPKKKLVYPRYDGGFFVTVFHDDAAAKGLRMKEQGVFVVPQKGALRVALCSVAERDVAKLVEALA